MNISSHADDIALAELLQWAMSTLSAAGVPEPDVDSELLVGHVLGLGRGEIACGDCGNAYQDPGCNLTGTKKSLAPSGVDLVR